MSVLRLGLSLLATLVTIVVCGSKTYPVTNVPAGGNTNEQFTTTAYGALSFTGGLVDYSQLSPSNPVNLVVKANQGALYLDQINIHNAAYGSYGSN